MDRALELGRPWAPYGMEARLMGGIAAYVDGDWDDALRILDCRDDLAAAAGRGRPRLGGPAGAREPW